MEGHNHVSQGRQGRGPRGRERDGGVRPIRDVLAEVLSQYRIALPEPPRRAPAAARDRGDGKRPWGTSATCPYETT